MDALILVVAVFLVFVTLVLGAWLIYYGLLGVRNRRTKLAYKRREWDVEGDAAVVVGVIYSLVGLGFFFTGVYRLALTMLALVS